MPTKRKSDYAPHISPDSARLCQAPGCSEAGAYKAPKSKEELNDYHFLCLEHVREHNQKWNYFDGLESDEIEQFMKDAVTGHRPTWTRESRLRNPYQQLHDKLYEFLNPGAKRPAPDAPRIGGKMRKALAALSMEHPYTAEALKTQYRTLVKKHHPDVNKGEKESEETFKRITVAYHYLREQLKEP